MSRFVWGVLKCKSWNQYGFALAGSHEYFISVEKSYQALIIITTYSELGVRQGTRDPRCGRVLIYTRVR